MANQKVDFYVAQNDVKSALIQGPTSLQSLELKMNTLISNVAAIAASMSAIESKLNALMVSLDTIVSIMQSMVAASQVQNPPVVLVDVGSQQITTEVD